MLAKIKFSLLISIIISAASKGMCNNNFTIQTHEVTLISPNGSESLAGGTSHPITWSATGTGFDSYRLLYLTIPEADTVACSVSSPHPYPNSYDSTWIISYPGAQKITVHFSKLLLSDNNDKVYVYDKNDNEIAKYSAPDSGTFWTQEIPSDTVKVRLVSNFFLSAYGFDIDKYAAFHIGGGYNDTIATNISPDSNSWDWRLPTICCTSVKVKVQMLDNLSNILAEDASDSSFTIQIYTTIISPNGSETWNGGSTYPVTWSTVGAGFDSYRLLYSLAPPVDTVTHSLSSPHSYPINYDSTWVISHPIAHKMKVHFSKFETEDEFDPVYLYDKDDIKIATYSGNLGAFWSAEVPGNIVKVRLKSDEEINYYGFDIDKYISFHGYNIIATDINQNSSSYNWTLPGTNSTTCKVKIQILDGDDNVISEDESDSCFSILESGTEESPQSTVYSPQLAVYPNPATENIVFKFSHDAGFTMQGSRLTIHDISGRLVRSLAINDSRLPTTEITWDRRDSQGKKVKSGIYFYSIKHKDSENKGKFVILK